MDAWLHECMIRVPCTVHRTLHVDGPLHAFIVFNRHPFARLYFASKAHSHTHTTRSVTATDHSQTVILNFAHEYLIRFIEIAGSHNLGPSQIVQTTNQCDNGDRKKLSSSSSLNHFIDKIYDFRWIWWNWISANWLNVDRPFIKLLLLQYNSSELAAN